jgi:4-hydroxybenzoate decarboxylase subunit C
MQDQLFPDLRAFLDRLRKDDDLFTIEAPVSARLEVAEIHRRVIAAGGPALLFTHVEGSELPLATNLFGTARRAELAFGRRPRALIERLAQSVETLLPPSLGKLWGARDLAFAALKVGTKSRSKGAVTEIVTKDVRLDRFPVLTSWPEDGGPFVTLPLVMTRHPVTGGSNLGVYRLQVHDARTTGMHWQIGKGGGFHYAVAEGRNESLPVTVFLGGPPALILAAVAPLPENVPEILLASLIAGGKLATCPGPGAHPLIADAEIALAGSVAPGLRRPEGPFGDHYGTYSLRHDYPVFEISHVARRKDAIYPATVVGKPRQEDFFIGDLLQELLSPLFPLVMPAVVDLWSYGETGYHALAAAVVKQRYAREAMASAFRILGEGQLSLTKFLLVLDRPVDLRDFKGVLTHLLERTHPETDLFVFSNVSMDTLDYTGPAVNEGSKGVWLGLGEPVRELPREFRPKTDPPLGVRDVRVFSPGCLVAGGPSVSIEPGFASRIASHPAFAEWPLVVLSDEPERAVASPINFLWTTFTRFEPGADIHAARKTIVRNHVSYTPPIVVDARTGPGFPAELFADEATSKKVTIRWNEYFRGRKIEMGTATIDHP